MISDRETDAHLAEVLKILKKKLGDGNKAALLEAVYQCLLMKRPLPEWLRLAFLDAYEARPRFEIKSWNEVFDWPVPKGTRLETEKMRRRVIERVWLLKMEDPKTAIDRGLFDQIGKELAISGGAANDLYYDERSRFLREMYEDAYHLLFGNPEKNEKISGIHPFSLRVSHCVRPDAVKRRGYVP
jgi:hypothetical protein